MMNSELEIRPIDRSSVDEQLEVYRAAFNPKEDYNTIKAFWEKKHYMNPIHDSYVFGAYDDTRLVSMNAYMPMKYRVENRTVNVIQSCESGTLPEYRGRGLWSKVVTYAINTFKEEGEYEFLIGFPNYENSYGGFMKMKWNHDTDINNYILIVNGKSFASALTGISIPCAKLLAIQKCKLSRKVFNKFSVVPYEYYEIIQNCKGFDILQTREFINWKKSYKSVEFFSIIDSEGKRVAICSYSLGWYKGERIALLYRIDTDKGDNKLRNLYSVAIQEIIRRHKNIAFIRTWVMPESVNEDAVRALGFLKSRHKNPFITYPLKNDNVNEAMLRDRNNWSQLTFMDLD